MKQSDPPDAKSLLADIAWQPFQGGPRKHTDRACGIFRRCERLDESDFSAPGAIRDGVGRGLASFKLKIHPGRKRKYLARV